MAAIDWVEKHARELSQQETVAEEAETCTCRESPRPNFNMLLIESFQNSSTFRCLLWNHKRKAPVSIQDVQHKFKERHSAKEAESSDVRPLSASNMDTFFRRHFKRKEAALQADVEVTPCRQRRPSVAVPTSKARRRSSVGLPSSTLTQRRRSSVQLPGGLPCAGGGRLAKTPRRNRWAGHGRRRSSTTTPSLNPRFAVCRKKVGKLRNIDTHLLGPSMLLASLIQMAEEDEEDGVGVGLPATEQQVEVRRMFSRSSSLHSDGDDDDGSDYSIANDSQSEDSQLSEEERLAEEEDVCPSSTPSSSSALEVMRRTPQPPPVSRPLIRAPRCLRRNSSQVFGDSAPYSCRRGASTRRKRRRISTISKAGSPWPGRGPPLPSRKSSVYYLNHPAFYRGPGALSPLGAHGYNTHLESWSSFLLYVVLSANMAAERQLIFSQT